MDILTKFNSLSISNNTSIGNVVDNLYALLSHKHPHIESSVDKLFIDYWLAWKDLPSKNLKYGLRASIEVNIESDSPIFNLSITTQSILSDNLSEDFTLLMSCDVTDIELPIKLHKAVKESNILFDTKKYCSELYYFLSYLNLFDSKMFNFNLIKINANTDLVIKPYAILYTNDDFNVPDCKILEGYNSEVAEACFLHQNPNCEITWIVQTDNEESAFNTYHEESTCE
jgi:hypothetical protein